MHQIPIIAHGFNHQSCYRQPMSNLRQIHEVVSNRNSVNQQIDSSTSSSFSSVSSSQPIFEHVNLEKQINSTSNNNIQQHIGLNQDSNGINHHVKNMINNQENGFATDLSDASNTNNTFRRQSRTTNKTPNINQNRFLSRQSSLDSRSKTDSISSQGSIPLATAHSANVLHDSIRRERKAHTMAPLTRISGPISSVKSNMFANIAAPNIAPPMKSSSLTQIVPNNAYGFYSQPGIEMNGAVDNRYGGGDDNAPIIVKVRYDPATGGPPPEATIRQLINNRLQTHSNKNFASEPIILNFSDDNINSLVPQGPTRPQQLYSNQRVGSVSPSTRHPHLQISTPTPEQKFQFLQQRQQQMQLRQRQQQLLLQQKRQQLQLEQKQQQQLQLEQKQQQQRQLQLQQQQLQLRQKEQLRRQQLELRQREQLKLQQQRQQLKLQQQREQQRLRQELLRQQQLQNQRLQQFLQQQNQQQQQIQQSEQQQRYRQLFQQRQQQTIQQKHRNPSLPPMGPRSSRPIGPVGSTAINRSSSVYAHNRDIHPIQSVPIFPTPLKTSNNISSVNPQRLPYRNFSLSQPSSPIPRDIGTFKNYPRKQPPSLFIPINFEAAGEQQSIPIPVNHTSSPYDASPYGLQRSYTVPLATEIYRPSSALDTPELSQENLLDMLNQIPDLHGRQFHIEYAEPTEPDGYPIPSQFDNDNDKYPVPVVVDQLPSDIIQHVRSSNNHALQVALDLADQVDQNFQPINQSQQSVQKYHSISSDSLYNTTDVYSSVEATLTRNRYI
ncbi:unnamed protein product [Rotaria sordida]|uniref:Uncharacterized protein n=1 Tax=Rotaria sordida TaxID=392033 RepID=A0A813QZ44_9BILA|nr:unnamed protein product [Rotaria sordida]CAF3561465.1 unnamed protein product [Rotaria sordida]